MVKEGDARYIESKVFLACFAVFLLSGKKKVICHLMQWKFLKKKLMQNH